MKHLRIRISSAWVLAVLATLLAGRVEGCGKAKWEGTYISSKDQSQLDLMPEHKAILKVGSVSTPDLSWEEKGEDKIVVHVPFPIEMFRITGGLRDQEGTEWKKK